MVVLTYEKRKCEGLKLAQIVERDIRKKKDAVLAGKGDKSPLSILVPARGISDEGAASIARALEEYLIHTGLGLEELKLCHNFLTVTGLAEFAAPIKLAAPWLKDFDISYNKISVTTENEVGSLERFLEAFSHAQVLRRLDLSGNDFSGPLAMETLWRVYQQQEAVDLTIMPIHRHWHGASTREGTLSRLGNLMLEDNGIDIVIKEGLRYVPYIVLQNTNLDDAGCLCLSFVLAAHHDPAQLRPLLSSKVAFTQLLDGYDDKSGCRGVIYNCDQPNPGLSPFVRWVMEGSENARPRLTSDDSEVEDDASVGTSPEQEEDLKTMRSTRVAHGTANALSHVKGRRNAKKVTLHDLKGLRQKLQREVIEKFGLHSLQLWSTAIKALSLARSVLSSGHAPRTRRRYASPVKKLADWPTPREARRPASPQKSRRGSPSKERIVWAERIAMEQELVHRDVRQTGDLPLAIWARILRYAVDPSGFLGAAQLERVVRYAADRKTLLDAKEHMRKDESTQKWALLDAMGCLAYE